jgi:dihydropteroate synthase
MGIPETALLYDPGMGFFLSENPMVSFRVLQELEILKLEFPQLMLGVSRKSFLGNILGNLPTADREFVTLACELHLLKNKIPFIRTHNVLKLRQAEKIWNLCQANE